MLEVIGENRLICFGNWAAKNALPYASWLYKRFIFYWIPVIMPIANLADKSRRLSRRVSSLLLISITASLIFTVVYTIMASLYGRVYASIAIKNFFGLLDVLFKLIVMCLMILTLIGMAVPIMLFSMAILMIALARLLSHRYIGIILKLISGVLFVVGVHFDVLAS
jgi:hypothetical protein